LHRTANDALRYNTQYANINEQEHAYNADVAAVQDVVDSI